MHAVEGKPDGAIHIRGRTTSSRVEIVIEDNGIGISREVMPRLMQPFFTTKPQGTGLGLWISQTLLSHQGAQLDLSSTPGEGTTVTISLPLSGGELTAA